MHYKSKAIANYGTVASVFSSPVCQFWSQKVQLLLECGADIHVINNAGHTAVEYAARAGDNPSIQMLLRAGASQIEAHKFNKILSAFPSADAVDDLGSTDGWNNVPGRSPQTIPGGGWDKHDNKAGLKHEISHCDIDRRDDLSPEEFMTEYVDKLKPVLLGPKVLKGNWSASHEWSKRRLRSVFGDVLVEGDTIDQKLTSEQKKRISDIPLSTFIDRRIDAMEHTGNPSPTDIPPYVLESTGNTRKLLQHVGEIGVFNYSQLEPQGFLWFLGPAFSGAPNHYHGHALNVLVHGAKRWFLTPPPHAEYDLKSGWEWYAQDYSRSKSKYKIYECMQYEAEVVYVPHSWGHVILNTRTSIGYAGEFKFYGQRGLPDTLTNASGMQPGLGRRWEEEPSTRRARTYEFLMQGRSQFSVWDKRAWSDHPLLGRDFL
jgi:hypothetical protein